MRWSLAYLILGGALCVAQQSSYELAPELLTLAKIKVHMQETLVRQPNYTCVEQIERSRRKAARFRYELIDNLRIEVALVDGHELFAWPGSAKFEEHDLDRIVPSGGAIGNGNFALFARTVFESNAPTFLYKGIETLDGRPVHHYDYLVSHMVSGLNVKVSGRQAIVGFHGSFRAEVDSLDVRRLEVVADDLPPFLGLSASSTTVDYARAKIGQANFLLPVASELVMTQLSGLEDRNQIRFSACRQYTGESVLKFGEAPESAPSAPAATVTTIEVTIPVGLFFEVALDNAIDSEKAMVGDTVQATLTKDLRLRKEVLMPKGAAATGRIVRLERHVGHMAVELKFSDLAAGNLHATLSTLLDIIPSSTSTGPAYRSAEPWAVVHSNDAGVIIRKGDRLSLPRGFKVSLTTGERDSSPPTVRD